MASPNGISSGMKRMNQESNNKRQETKCTSFWKRSFIMITFWFLEKQTNTKFNPNVLATVFLLYYSTLNNY